MIKKAFIEEKPPAPNDSSEQAAKHVMDIIVTLGIHEINEYEFCPLGYIRYPEIKNAIVIDVETRWIIEKIFDLALHGARAAKSAKVLAGEKVLDTIYMPSGSGCLSMR